MCWPLAKDLHGYSYYQFLNASGNGITLDQLLALTTILPLRSTGLYDVILWHWIACFLYNSLFTTIYYYLLLHCWKNAVHFEVSPLQTIGRLLSGSRLNLTLNEHNEME